MDTNGGFTGWVLAGIGVIVSTLAGVVAMLYKSQVTHYQTREIELKEDLKTFKAETNAKIAALEKRADACESDRDAMRVKNAVLEQRISWLDQTKKTRDSINLDS